MNKLYLYSELGDEWGYTPADSYGLLSDCPYHLWNEIAAQSEDIQDEIMRVFFATAYYQRANPYISNVKPEVVIHGVCIHFKWVQVADDSDFPHLHLTA